MASKTMEHHVFLALIEISTFTCTFDLWMAQGGFDILSLVVNYINKKWVACHITIGILEVQETYKATMAMQIQDSFDNYKLLNKVITYVKDEGANLSILITMLTSIVSYVPFRLPQPYVANCFGHATSKCCNMLLTISKCGGITRRYF